MPAHKVLPPRPRLGARGLISATLVLTALFGVGLRLDLASGALSAGGLDFANVRHAHSHLGFYGFLTLAWWSILREREALSLPPWLVPTHLGVVLVATVLFTTSGYVWSTIALSTVVAGSWLYVAWRSRRVKGWLSLAPWGVLAGTLLVPAIAVMARRDFGLSRQLAHVFVALMVLWVFVPMALSTLRVPVVSRWAWLVTTAIGSTYLVFSGAGSEAGWPWPLGLFLSLAGALLLISLWRARTDVLAWPRPLAFVWLAMALGLVVLGLLPPLQIEATRLAALHFTVLGPVTLTLWDRLAPEHSRQSPLVEVYLLALLVMVSAMVLGPLGVLAYDLAMDVALWAGVGLVVSAVVAVIVSALSPRRLRGA